MFIFCAIRRYRHILVLYWLLNSPFLFQLLFLSLMASLGVLGGVFYTQDTITRLTDEKNSLQSKVDEQVWSLFSLFTSFDKFAQQSLSLD